MIKTKQLIIKILQSYSKDFDVGAQTFIGMDEDNYEEAANEIISKILSIERNDLNEILKDVEEFEKLNRDTSPWPWANVKDGEGGFVVIHSAKNDEKHDVCYSSTTEVFDQCLIDMNFIAAAKNFPTIEVIRELVEEVKRLEVLVQSYKD